VALIHNPALIILDEPTNGLDPQGIADMRNLILRLSKEMGKTVVVSSHLLSEIELIANRMIIIHKGKKMVEGKVAELLDPAKSLIQINTTDNETAKAKLLSSKWASTLKENTQLLQLKMHKEDVPELVKALAAMDINILSINPTNSLEQYFLSLTTQAGIVEAFTN
jgi:ABC-type multidrug transport system ATPase subunit